LSQFWLIMAKPPTEASAAELTVPERVLLFCLASDTNWVKGEARRPPRRQPTARPSNGNQTGG
jgi:hypothetical protein